MSPEAVLRLYQGSDIFVIPSYSEGFPNALLEAISDILAAGKCGLLIDPGDHLQLTSALIRLAEDGELRKRLGGAARKQVEDYYALPHLERAFEAVLNSVFRQDKDIRFRGDTCNRNVP